MLLQLTSLLVLTFFGLTPQYRKHIFNQIHDLVFHGGGGFQYYDVYNMPIWLRRFHIQKISEFNKKQNEEMEKAKKGQTNSDNVFGPNINPNPSSVYDFKK
jgi:hypothetical protein